MTPPPAIWHTRFGHSSRRDRAYVVADLQALRQLVGPVTPRLLFTRKRASTTAARSGDR